LKRVILISGCSSGFGKLAAVRCARKGATVVATMRNLDRRAALDAAAEAAGVQLDVRQLDVVDPESRRACVEGVLRDHGQIDVLVNNAGFGIFGPFEEVPEAELRAIFETNFFGAAELTRLVLPAMRDNRRGTVINVSSGQGRAGIPGFSTYGASKFAVEGWSQAMAHEVGLFGVRVCCIEPGSCKTEFSFASMHRHAHTDSGPYARQMAAVQRFMAPIYMASPERVARAITRMSFRRRPPARVPIGVDTRALLWAKTFLGLRLLRWITRAILPRLAPRAARESTPAPPAP